MIPVDLVEQNYVPDHFSDESSGSEESDDFRIPARIDLTARWQGTRSGRVPGQAFAAAWSSWNSPSGVFVARVHHQGQLLPAMGTRRGRAVACSDGQLLSFTKFEVLMQDAHALRWLVTDKDYLCLPENSLVVSRDSHGEPLYVGRVYDESNNCYLGKVFRRVCYIPWHGRERLATKFEILTTNAQ